MPERIRKRRVAGWKGDRDPVYVGRGSVFGNPYKLGTRDALARMPAADLETPWEYEGRISADGAQHDMHWPSGMVTQHTIRYMTIDEVVTTYRSALLLPRPGLALIHRHRGKKFCITEVTVALVRERLAGRDLSCWCPPSSACHADVLLWVANAPDEEIAEAVAAEREKVCAYTRRLYALHPEIRPRPKAVAGEALATAAGRP